MTRSDSPHSWLKEGMDPSSSYFLKIKLLGNRNKARKDLGYFSLTNVVDADTTNWKDFIESIIDEFQPRYKKVPFVQYFDHILRSYPEVKSDQDLLVMFDKHAETKIVRIFIAYYDPSDTCPEPIVEWPPSSPEKEGIEAQEGVQGQIRDNVQIKQEDNYLVNPLSENEHVGIDEEGIYLGEELAYAMAVTTVPSKENCANEDATCGSSSKDAISESSSEGAISNSEENSEASSDFQDVVADFEEKEDLVGKDSLLDHVSIVDYDKEDPPMEVRSTYPNMKEFKLALAQHAIKHEFEYNMEKSDPNRYRVYCARKRQDKFAWRLHASTIGDRVTIKVKKNSAAHECSSSRRTKKVKNASKF